MVLFCYSNMYFVILVAWIHSTLALSPMETVMTELGRIDLDHPLEEMFGLEDLDLLHHVDAYESHFPSSSYKDEDHDAGYHRRRSKRSISATSYDDSLKFTKFRVDGVDETPAFDFTGIDADYFKVGNIISSSSRLKLYIFYSVQGASPMIHVYRDGSLISCFATTSAAKQIKCSSGLTAPATSSIPEDPDFTPAHQTVRLTTHPSLPSDTFFLVQVKMLVI